jgi:hypothetical protein
MIKKNLLYLNTIAGKPYFCPKRKMVILNDKKYASFWRMFDVRI